MIIKRFLASGSGRPCGCAPSPLARSFYIPPAAPARRWQSVLASPPFGVVGVLLSGAAASRPRLCAVPPLPRAAVRLRRSRRSRSVAPALNALPPAASRLRCPCAPALLLGQRAYALAARQRRRTGHRRHCGEDSALTVVKGKCTAATPPPLTRLPPRKFFIFGAVSPLTLMRGVFLW